MPAWRLRLGRGRRRPGTGARRGRFRHMLNNNVLWPGMIGIALAVGIGVQMGESAIGAIDPVHFQGAAPPVQAIDPNSPPPQQSSYAQAYGWTEGDAARQADMAAWGAPRDFDYVPEPVVQQASAPAWREPPAHVTLAPWPPGQISSHPEVERYADYPIEEKPAARPAAPPAARQSPQTEQDAPEADDPPADQTGN